MLHGYDIEGGTSLGAVCPPVGSAFHGSLMPAACALSLAGPGSYPPHRELCSFVAAKPSPSSAVWRPVVREGVFWRCGGKTAICWAPYFL
mmetsp:Transcript_4735/g.14053  ORF Transcript_4735/g.14053 Transcript_4735/m.14053 type:complete len:90 (-) Transcript_4735:1952-2221(-)